MVGTTYLVYHTCHTTLCIMYASRGLFKLRNNSWLNDLYGEDNASKCRCASIPQYKDWIYRFAKTCAIFALLTYKSITCLASLIVHTFLTTTSHTPDALQWYGLQFLNQSIDKVLYILWMMISLSNTSRKNAPCMFCWVEVWRPGWPVHHTDTCVINEGHGNLSCVGRRIVLH